MGSQDQTPLHLTVVVLALISSVHATCHANGRDSGGKKCRFKLSAGAALGIAVGIIGAILGLASLLAWRRRRQARRANLAFVPNTQLEQGNNYEGSTPIYQPSFAANISPNYIPNQIYPASPQTYHPPPGSPPLQDKGELPKYEPPHPLQFPQPTYNA